jgi:hypothetical protein
MPAHLRCAGTFAHRSPKSIAQWLCCMWKSAPAKLATQAKEVVAKPGRLATNINYYIRLFPERYEAAMKAAQIANKAKLVAQQESYVALLTWVAKAQFAKESKDIVAEVNHGRAEEHKQGLAKY